MALYLSGDPEADRLLSEDPLTLLIAMVLDQQVPIEHAFLGPLRIRERLGTLDAGRLATIDAEAFTTAFRIPPAIHRFPASMAERVQGLCHTVAERWLLEAGKADPERYREVCDRFPVLSPVEIRRCLKREIMAAMGTRSPASWSARPLPGSPGGTGWRRRPRTLPPGARAPLSSTATRRAT
jgi:hypothetical protein